MDPHSWQMIGLPDYLSVTCEYALPGLDPTLIFHVLRIAHQCVGHASPSQDLTISVTTMCISDIEALLNMKRGVLE